MEAFPGAGAPFRAEEAFLEVELLELVRPDKDNDSRASCPEAVPYREGRFDIDLVVGDDIAVHWEAAFPGEVPFPLADPFQGEVPCQVGAVAAVAAVAAEACSDSFA